MTTVSTYELLRRALRRVTSEIETDLRTDLTAAQIEVLTALAEAPAIQVMLTVATGIDRSTISAIMRRLSARGLIERRHPPGDNRAWLWSITDTGCSQLATAKKVIRDVEARIAAATDHHETMRTGLTAVARQVVDDEVMA